MSGHPAYRVPTMAEVRALPWNGLAVASLFAGGGGSSTGYRMAGYRVAWANDVVPEALATYRANCAPHTVLDGRDVRELRGSAVLDAVEALTGRRELDVLDGSPPCQAFSLAGPRDRSWGHEVAHADGTTQRSDDLFFEYARLLDEVRPRAFVAENVPGLLRGVARGYFKRILAALRAPGYRVACRLLSADWLGVPQARDRAVFVGVRADLPSEPAFPRPLPWRHALADVVPGCLRVEAEGYGKLHVVDAREPCRTITASGFSAFGDSYRLVMADGERRRFTLDELKAVCSFPPDYVLTGSYREGWTRLGNSVPPLLMRAVAETLRDRVLAGTAP